jgi:hypothetical protein
MGCQQESQAPSGQGHPPRPAHEQRTPWDVELETIQLWCGRESQSETCKQRRVPTKQTMRPAGCGVRTRTSLPGRGKRRRCEAFCGTKSCGPSWRSTSSVKPQYSSLAERQYFGTVGSWFNPSYCNQKRKPSPVRRRKRLNARPARELSLVEARKAKPVHRQVEQLEACNLWGIESRGVVAGIRSGWPNRPGVVTTMGTWWKRREPPSPGIIRREVTMAGAYSQLRPSKPC